MIEVRYRCSCFPPNKQRLLTVEPRRLGEDGPSWLERIVRPCVSADHHEQSPSCKMMKVEYVKYAIPSLIGTTVKAANDD